MTEQKKTLAEIAQQRAENAQELSEILARTELNAEATRAAQNWEFNNGISVTSHPRDLTFDVYYDDDYLGCIGCDTQKDFVACIHQLDSGKDPVSAGWDDGAMNGCDIIGWGENEKELTKRQETALRKEFGARKKGLKKWWFD